MVNNTKGYKESMNAMIPFSEKVLEQLPNAKISLIGFGSYPKLLRDYASVKLEESDFKDETKKGNKQMWLGYTNVPGGLDFATSMIYNKIPASDRNNVYTILLHDGAPSNYTYMQIKQNDKAQKYTINGKNQTNLSPQLLYQSNENSYIISGLAETYYKNLINIENDNGNIQIVKDIIISADGSEKISFVSVKNKTFTPSEYSANYLKAIGSKIIVLGYNIGSNSLIKTVSTKVTSIDDEFCSDGQEYDSKHYCYYKLNSTNIDEKFQQFATQIIKYSSANAIKLVLEPAKNENGDPLITIYKNNNKIEKIEELNDLTKESNGELKIKGDYQFQLNDYLFDQMNCSKETCTYNDAIKLFDMKLVLLYPDNDTQEIDVEDPLFNMSLTKINTLN